MRASSVRVRLAALLVACVTALVTVVGATAERQRRGFGFGAPIRSPQPEMFNGGFNFCRIAFDRSRDGDGGGWGVDYPRADANLSIRLSELTRTRLSRDAGGEPNYFVIRLTDDALFQCPFIMMTEVGSMYLSPPEVTRLREYLLKGGFLWADDFWGSYAWEVWAREFENVLPRAQYQTIDLPGAHPLFHVQFQMRAVPQVPSINYWAGSGGDTSERGEDSREPHARGIADSSGRLMVLMTHNTDLGDSFEREADDPTYFYTFSVPGYAFGINVVLYALTH